MYLLFFKKTCKYRTLGGGGGGGGGGPEKKFAYFGGIQKNNGNFQIFTHPPPLLINNERSLRIGTCKNTVFIKKRIKTSNVQGGQMDPHRFF